MNPRFDLRWLYLLLMLIFATLYVALAGCDTEGHKAYLREVGKQEALNDVPPQPAIDPVVLQYAVLDVLQKAMPVLKGDDTDPLTQTEGQCTLKELAATRAWARATITDTQMRAEYLNWIDFYEDKVRRRMSAVADNQAIKVKSQLAQGRTLADTLPQPPPSKEQCQ